MHANHNLSATDLESRCDQLGLHVDDRDFTPARIIPLLERRITEWQNHPSANADQNTLEYIDWKLTLNKLNRFLLELRPIDSRNNNAPLRFHQGGPRCENPLENRQTPIAAPLTQVDPKNHKDQRKLTADEQRIVAVLNGAPNPLNDLNDDQQRKLYELLCEHENADVIKILALPPPTGWNLQTNQSALQRFFNRVQKRFLLEASRAALAEREISDELEDDPSLTDDQLTATSERYFKLRLRNHNRSRNTDIRELWQLYQIHIRQRQLDIAERRLAYLESKQSQRVTLSAEAK